MILIGEQERLRYYGFIRAQLTVEQRDASEWSLCRKRTSNNPPELYIFQHGHYDHTWLILVMHKSRMGKRGTNDSGTYEVVPFDRTSAGGSFTFCQAANVRLYNTIYQRTTPNNFYSDNAHVGLVVSVINTLT